VNFDALDPVIAKAVYPPPRTVAMIGLSNRPGRPSHDVAGALLRWGYRVIPVNPGVESIFGVRCYPDLASVAEAVDIVSVFRRSEHVGQHLADILARKPGLLWLQDGVRDEHMATEARQAGILVVQNDCIARRVRALLHNDLP
jgi:predicted CoA-binding protein